VAAHLVGGADQSGSSIRLGCWNNLCGHSGILVGALVLPCLTLALRPCSYFTQVTRASMVTVLESPYMTAARARGAQLSGDHDAARHTQ